MRDTSILAWQTKTKDVADQEKGEGLRVLCLGPELAPHLPLPFKCGRSAMDTEKGALCQDIGPGHADGFGRVSCWYHVEGFAGIQGAVILGGPIFGPRQLLFRLALFLEPSCLGTERSVLKTVNDGRTKMRDEPFE